MKYFRPPVVARYEYEPFKGWLRDGPDHVVEEFLHRIFVQVLDVARRIAAGRPYRIRSQIAAAYLLVL